MPVILPANEITGSFFRIRQEEPTFTNLLIETGYSGSQGVCFEIYYPGLSIRLAIIVGVFLRELLNYRMPSHRIEY